MKGISLRILFLLPLALLAGCPGSSAPDVQGTWAVMGTSPGGNSVSGVAAIVKDGQAFIYMDDEAGDLYLFGPPFTPLTDQRSLSGGASHFELADCGHSECVPEADSYVGTAYADHIGLSFTMPLITNGSGPNVGPGGTAELDRVDALSGVAIGSLRDLPAQWQGFYLPGNIAVTVTNKGDGTLAGNDGFGCAFTGNIESSGDAGQTTTGVDTVTLTGTFEQFGAVVGCTGIDTGAGYFTTTGIGPFKGVSGLYFLTGVSSGLTGYMLEFKVK